MTAALPGQATAPRRIVSGGSSASSTQLPGAAAAARVTIAVSQ